MASALALVVCALAYISIGLICVAMFGKEVKSDLLMNFAQESGIISISVRLLFCTLLLIHIPFIFMPTKEFALVLHDEIARRSLSDHLERKLKLSAEKDAAAKAKKDEKEDSDQEELLDEKKENDPKQDEEIVSQTSEATNLSEKSQLAYKELSDEIFFVYTFLIYLAIVLCSIFIKDITKIFDSVEAVGSSCLTFLFPGAFYIMTYAYHAKERKKQKFMSKCYLLLSWFMIMLGIIMTCVALYVSFYKMFNENDKGDAYHIQKHATEQ